MALALVNESTSHRIATRVELAVTPRARRRGLLGRHRFDPSTALVLVPCVAVHTAFMRFPIDVVFINGEGRAVHVVERMRPWRLAISAAARGVVELPAGSLRRLDLRVGDRVFLVRAGDDGTDNEAELQKVMTCLEVRAA